MLGDQRGADGVEREDLRHRRRIEPLVGPLRPCAVRKSENAGRHDHPLGRIIAHRVGGGGDSRLVGKIEGEGAENAAVGLLTPARSGINAHTTRRRQSFAQRPADPARRAEHAGRAGHACSALSYIIHAA